MTDWGRAEPLEDIRGAVAIAGIGETAYTKASGRTAREIGAEAADNLSAEAYQAALGAASIMGMNNVFYRGRHFLDGSYDDLRPGLRMNIIGNPGVDKANFELWSFAVSAINGCQACVASHEQVVREAGVGREAVLEALKVASIVAGVAQAVFAASADPTAT